MTDAGGWIRPEIERERMQAVEQLGLLDTPKEERFDRIARMTRRVLGVPMCSVSLMDRDRQWFKSIEGLALTEVPRDRTVCQTTIARTYRAVPDPVLVVEDAADDPRFSEIPGIGGDGGIRFYAGYPLYGPGGHTVGTFCVYDETPRTLDDEELTNFAEMAGMVQRELEWSEDLARGADIQRSLLPRPLQGQKGYAVSGACLPAFVVGGDFYDHHVVDDRLVVTVADVMGKGTGAAIVAAAVRSTFRGATRAFARLAGETQADVDAGVAASAAAEQLAEDLDGTDTFVTAFHAVVDLPTGTVTYVDAGHGLSMVRRRDGTVEPLRGSGLPLGIALDDTWDSHTSSLSPGDMLVVCSDGLLDLLDEDSDPRAVHAFVAAHVDAAGLVAAVGDLVAEMPPLDDVTIVAIGREDA